VVAENRKRVEVGGVAPGRAAIQVASRQHRADLLQAQSVADTQQRLLKNLLSDDYTKWKDVAVRPTQALFALPQQFDLQQSWKKD
jgi:hypothetical protein